MERWTLWHRERGRKKDTSLPLSPPSSFLPLLPLVSECLGEIGARGGEDSRGPFFSRPLCFSPDDEREEGGSLFPLLPALSLSRSQGREARTHTPTGREKREKNGLREGRSNTLSSSEMKVGLFVCTTPAQSPSSLSPGAASDASRNLLPPSSSSSFSSGRRENGMEWGGEPVQSPERPQRRREKRALRQRRRRTAVCAPSVRSPLSASDRQTVAPSVGRRKTTFCILFVRPLLLDPWQVAADERLSCEKDPSTM